MAEYSPSKIIKDGNTYNFRDTTKIPLAGSNQISGSLIPATTDSVNLGSPSYQWNNAYIKSLTINGVACGDILTHNASEFVDVSSNQTIGGVKTFSDAVNNKNVQQFIFNKEYNDATDTWLGIHNYLDKNSTRLGLYSIGNFSGNRGFRWFIRGQSTNSVETDIFGFGRKMNETSYMYINATLETDLIPTNNNSKSLGTSTNKWKSFNGINPGALSLPNIATGSVDIRSTVGQYLKDNNTNVYEFTAPFDGWICVGIKKGSLRIDNNTTIISSGSEIRGYWISYTIPFMKNNSIQIKIDKMDATDDYVTDIMWKAFIHPCQGNV